MSSARRSAKYIFYGNLLIRAITFTSSIVLARILFPEDYGYLVAASVITEFLSIIGNTGFENFYLQEEIKSKKYEDTILSITFKLRVVLSIALFIVQILISYVVMAYADNTILGEMLAIYSFTIPIVFMAQIPIYVARKRLNFKAEVYANTLKALTDSISKITFALYGFGALSFAFGSLLASLVFSITIYYLVAYKVKFDLWNKKIFLKILYFGKHYFISSVFGYFSRYTDKIILVNNFNMASVGLYNFAFSQANNIRAKTSQPMGKLIISYIAKNKNDFNRIYKTLISITTFEIILFTPIYIILYLYSAEIIDFVFGDKWMDAVPIFRVFLILGIFQSISGGAINILTGLGYPAIQSKLSLYNFIVSSSALTIIALMSSGMEAYALAYSLIVISFSLLKAMIGLVKIDHSPYGFFRDIHLVRHIVLFSLLSISLYFLKETIIESTVISFCVSILFSALYMFGWHFVFFWNDFIDSLTTILGKAHRIIVFLRKLKKEADRV